MEITYIGHSGFLMEWESCYWLFDYYTGEIPLLNREKKLFVFASHKHGDHYNPDIFDLQSKYDRVQYILSSDIKVSSKRLSGKGGFGGAADTIVSVKPSAQYEFYDQNQEKIELRTLKSTDCGVAFLLKYQGKTVYHAGDLNLWVWKEETKQYNNDMRAKFQKEIKKLEGMVGSPTIAIDIAFVPLDPRQEEWYYLGMEYLMNTVKIKYLFPMHFWNKPSIIKQFLNERGSGNDTRIMEVDSAGQSWSIEKK
jgi:hypothetical protein